MGTLKLGDLAFWKPSFTTFADRADAGRRLAARLEALSFDDPLVLALPRGGVEVGFEIAQVLHAPLDVVPARKLGAPQEPELAIGAIAPGAAVLSEHLIAQLGLSSQEIERVIAREELEMARRAAAFRAGLPPLELAGKTVILVDDGLATGATAAAAIKSIRRGGPRKLILAIPVGARATVEALRERVDDLICLETPAEFRAVGEWYRNFDQTSDQRVIELLRRAAAPQPRRTMSPRTPSTASETGTREQRVSIPAGKTRLEGNLTLPAGASGLVLFAHGTGSSRLSPRNVSVARTLNEAGVGTLLFDLLTEREGTNRSHVFDLALLADRLVVASRWCRAQGELATLPQGYFGASTGAGAALVAAAGDSAIRAVVSRGGRPDLAGEHLGTVSAPTLLIVGGADAPVAGLNEEALALLTCVKKLVIIPGATHLFEEPGTLEEVARLASSWFAQYLRGGS